MHERARLDLFHGEEGNADPCEGSLPCRYHLVDREARLERYAMPIGLARAVEQLPHRPGRSRSRGDEVVRGQTVDGPWTPTPRHVRRTGEEAAGRVDELSRDEVS